MDETGKKRVTATDVARALGISRATVGFVLNNTRGQTISAETRRRVLAEAARLGYRPHRAAADLRRGSSRIILFVLPEWPMGFRSHQHLDEAALALDEAGYSLVTYARQLTGRTRPLWELLDPEVVVGLGPFDEEELASMRACGITKIVPDPARSPSLDEWPTITDGPGIQVAHLAERGHRRIAFAGTADPRSSLLMDARVRATRAAARRLRVDLVDVRPVDHRDDSGSAAVRRWQDAGVTGVVAYNDDIAAVVVGSAIRVGMSVPDDLAVIGHDDTPLASLFVPSISSVRIDTVNLGRHFAALALHEADGRPLPSRDVEADLVVVPRESTRFALVDGRRPASPREH